MTEQESRPHTHWGDYQSGFKSFRTAPAEIPFVGFKAHSHHIVKSTDNDNYAYDSGKKYAVQFAQFLTNNVEWIGSNLLGHMVQEIYDQYGNDPTKSYAAGFFSFLEYLIYYAAEHIDVSAYAKQIQDDHREGVKRGNPVRTCDCD